MPPERDRAVGSPGGPAQGPGSVGRTASRGPPAPASFRRRVRPLPRPQPPPALPELAARLAHQPSFPTGAFPSGILSFCVTSSVSRLPSASRFFVPFIPFFPFDEFPSRTLPSSRPLTALSKASAAFQDSHLRPPASPLPGASRPAFLIPSAPPVQTREPRPPSALTTSPLRLLFLKLGCACRLGAGHAVKPRFPAGQAGIILFLQRPWMDGGVRAGWGCMLGGRGP